eukprot:39866-Eustigmatos_ZCMA.PRE.1
MTRWLGLGAGGGTAVHAWGGRGGRGVVPVHGLLVAGSQAQDERCEDQHGDVAGARHDDGLEGAEVEDVRRPAIAGGQMEGGYHKKRPVLGIT